MAMAAVYDDLDELVEADELTEQFTKAANHLQTIVSNLPNETLLQLYGLYKQGLEGPCNTPKPSWYDVRGKAKWEAWKKLGDLSQIDAKTQYVKLIKNIDENFDSSEGSGDKQSWVRVSTLQSCKDDEDNTENPLKDYINEGNCQKVDEILTQEKIDLNELDEDGMGYIHWASDRGYVSLLKVLMKHGVNINLKDETGQTALHYAASCDHIDCVKFLLENGLDPTVQDEEKSLAIDLTNNAEIKDLLTEFSNKKC